MADDVRQNIIFLKPRAAMKKSVGTEEDLIEQLHATLQAQNAAIAAQRRLIDLLLDERGAVKKCTSFAARRAGQAQKL